MNHKPFNLEHAKAGAPVQLLDGTEATIIKFDGRNDAFPLVVLVGSIDTPTMGTVNGQLQPLGAVLAMKPFGYCEGKPVHVGDTLIHKAADSCGSIVRPGCTRTDFSEFSWPQQYPVTQLSNDTLADYVCTMPSTDDLRQVANAAIQHGIDNGYLMAPDGDVDQHFKLAKDRGKYLGQIAKTIGMMPIYAYADVPVAVERYVMAVARHFYTSMYQGNAPVSLPGRPMPPDEFFTNELAKVKP